MNLPLPATRWIVTLCVAMLLIAQVMGLHRHQHVELQSGAHSHGVELHFEDGGLHLYEERDEHRHDVHAPGGGHAHLDIESKVVEPALVKAKFFATSLLAVLIYAAILLLLPRGAGSFRPSTAPLTQACRPRYGLGPPSQAPPQHLVVA